MKLEPMKWIKVNQITGEPAKKKVTVLNRMIMCAMKSGFGL